jgi:acylphosphatase
MKRVHVFYTGNVQAVGFRYTVQDIAITLGVYGWVKNLESSRVEVIAEAEETKLNEFLNKILKGSLGRYIKDVNLTWKKPTKEFKDFDIKFDYSSI